MAFGVIDTSHTGPSYSPLGTPLSSASFAERHREADFQLSGICFEATWTPPRQHLKKPKHTLLRAFILL